MQYFFSKYMKERGDNDYSASWFCGLGSWSHEGHAPSQQTAEQFNAMAKADLRHIDPNLGTHAAVVEAFWKQRAEHAPLDPAEHDSPGPRFTLNAADSHIGMAKPSRPFGMMLHGRPGKSEKGFPDSRPGFSKQEWFPTVKTILEEMRKKSSRVYQVVKEARSNSW